MKTANRLREKTAFTIPDVARLCSVCPATAVRWFDSGRLRGYRVPGSGHRRVSRDHLERFLKEYDLPGLDKLIDDLETAHP